MRRWGADDIPWHSFDPSRLAPDILPLVKAAAMVEHNAGDYTHYLRTIFRTEPAFLDVADRWGEEEVLHGAVLGRYAEMADPGFNFKRHFERFVAGYQIPLERTASVRGSLTGELIARCIVETGTSSLYSSLRDAIDEPVLKAICHRIAGDEFRHYKMFYNLMRKLRTPERLTLVRRLLVAIGRIREADDDELSYAWYAANEPFDSPYRRDHCAREYARHAFRHYRDHHAERVVAMIMKAIGLDPTGWLGAKVKAFAKRRLKALAAR